MKSTYQEVEKLINQLVDSARRLGGISVCLKLGDHLPSKQKDLLDAAFQEVKSIKDRVLAVYGMDQNP